jgi:periplasmic divalent cation tolerance protein
VTPVIVLTTVGPAFDAKGLAQDLVERRLVACVNIIERIHSVYRWDTKIEQEAEQLLMMKTVEERVPELKKVLRQKHPYDTPEFIVVNIDDIGGAYEEWLLKSISQ